MVRRYDRNYPMDLWLNGSRHTIRCSNFDSTPDKMRIFLRAAANSRGLGFDVHVKDRKWLVVKATRISDFKV